MKKMKNVITKLLLTSLVFTGIFIPGRSFASNEIRSNKLSKIETQKSMVLKQVKDLLEKSGDIHLYEQAKKDIDNIFYKNIEHGFSLFGNGSLDNPNTGYGTVYMPNGGVVGGEILGGRMKFIYTYIPREQAFKVLDSKPIEKAFELGATTAWSIIKSKLNVTISQFLGTLGYLNSLREVSNSFIVDELNKNKEMSIYISEIYDKKEYATSRAFAPWDTVPFVDVFDAQYYEIVR